MTSMRRRKIRIPVILSAISLIFCVYYFSFFLFSPFFRFQPAVDKGLLNSWVWPVVGAKGAELYILFFGTILFIVASYFAIIYSKFIPLISNKFVQFVLIFAILLKILTTNPNFGTTPGIFPNIFLISAVLIIVGLGFKYHKRFLNLPKKLKTISLLTFWSLFGVVSILSIREVDYMDYNFFIGPALKLSGGENLQGFYMQYGLLETYLFRLMIDFGFKLHHMELVLGIILVFFFVLYQKVASNLIRGRFFSFPLYVFFNLDSIFIFNVPSRE